MRITEVETHGICPPLQAWNNRPVDIDYWYDDGAAEFSTTRERTAAGKVS